MKDFLSLYSAMIIFYVQMQIYSDGQYGQQNDWKENKLERICN